MIAYRQLLRPWVCLLAYLWALEFQSVYEPRYNPFVDSIADCGVILWCAGLALAVTLIPIAILAGTVFGTGMIRVNRWAVKIGTLLVTYFYFRRWLDRWTVTEFTNSFVLSILALSALLLAGWSLRRSYDTKEGRFEFPSFEDCYSYGAVPIFSLSAVIFSVKVIGHLLANGPTTLTAAAVSELNHRAAQGRPNIVLITADALRAESTFLGKHDKKTFTPFLETLAAKSTTYPQMHSNAMSTSAAVTTILSGKHPLAHGNLTRKVQRYDSHQNLFALLKANGYTTVAVTSNGEAAKVVAAMGQYLSRPHIPELGSKLLLWLRGIGVYPSVAGAAMYRDLYIIQRFIRGLHIDLPHGYANDTFDLAGRVLADTPEPFFLFVHVHEPHVPYYSLSLSSENKNAGRDDLKIEGEVSPPFAGYYPLTSQSRVDTYRRHYEESVRFLDYQLERFLRVLERQGLMRDLLLLFVSDHGESFNRGYLGHGDELYEDSTRVPLVVHFPGQITGERFSGLVQSSDLAPTIVEAAGLETPTWMTGQALRPGRPPESRDTIAVNYKQPTADGYSLFPTLMSIWSGTFKLIISCQGDRVELYDLEKDDQEAVNLATEKKDVVKSLRQKLIVELEKQTTEAKFSCKFNH